MITTLNIFDIIQVEDVNGIYRKKPNLQQSLYVIFKKKTVNFVIKKEEECKMKEKKRAI